MISAPSVMNGVKVPPPPPPAPYVTPYGWPCPSGGGWHIYTFATVLRVTPLYGSMGGLGTQENRDTIIPPGEAMGANAAGRLVL